MQPNSSTLEVVSADYAKVERRIVNWPSVTFTHRYFEQALAAERTMRSCASFAALYSKVHGDTVIVDELHDPSSNDMGEKQHATAPQCSRLVSALIRRIT